MLTLERIIIESDSDLEIVATIVTGYDTMKHFVIQFIYEDYRKGGRNNSYCAVMDEEEVATMAHHLHISPNELPQALYDAFGDKSGIAVPSEVESVFQEILEYILDCGARYSLKNR